MLVQEYYNICSNISIMDYGIQGKTYLVTGASGGIGLSISKILLEEEANVIVHYNTNRARVDELISQYPDYTSRILPVQADLTNEESVKQMFQIIKEKYGRIQGLINNAGIWPSDDIPIHKMSLEHWNHTLQTNLTAYFLCTREFISQLTNYPNDPYATIVLIGSTAGIFGEADHIDYSVTKAALQGLMLSVKNELPRISRYGRVNIVSPGWTATPMAKEGLADKKNVSKVLQTTAMRKIAKPEDVAHVVCFLLSDKLSGHVSGQNIAVTGGMEGRLLYYPDQVDASKPTGE